jgi:hypothetical protein
LNQEIEGDREESRAKVMVLATWTNRFLLLGVNESKTRT